MKSINEKHKTYLLRQRIRRQVIRAMREAGIESAKGKQCEHCNAPATERHHDDYSKPLEILYLCVRCHKKRHASLGSGVKTYAEIIDFARETR